MSKLNHEQPAAQHLSTYETAPARNRELTGLDIFNTRQLRRWVEQGKVEHLKVGHRVFFTDAHLLALVESLTVKAVR